MAYIYNVKMISHKYFNDWALKMKQEKLNTKIRQKQIVDTCLEIISEKGVGALNVTDLAARLGLATSALYRHYSSKEQIISAILELTRQRVIEDLVKVKTCEGNLFDKLEFLLSIEADRMQERRAFYLILFSDSTLKQNHNELNIIRSIVSDFIAEFTEIFEEGQNAGLIRNDISPTMLQHMFVNLLLANTPMQIIQPDNFDIYEYQNQAWLVFKEMISMK